MNHLIKNSKVISVREFFTAEPRDINVPESHEISIGPNVENYQNFYHFIAVKSIDDLKQLNLIPSEINIDKLKKAIQSDDEVAVKIAKKNFKYDLKECDCPDKKQSSLTSFYAGIREQSHFELTNLLADYYNKKLDWDSNEVKHTYRWTSMLTDAARSIILSVLYANDIIIKHNSTMIVKVGTDLIRGRDLRIYSGGKMVIQTSYLFLKLLSAQGNIRDFIVDKKHISEKF